MTEAVHHPDDAFDLDAFLPYQLAVLSARVSREFGRIYTRQFGISIAEWRVIAHLAQAGTVSVREIHARVDMDKSKVSRAAARLEHAGLLTKAAAKDDRRLVALSLTSEGQALFDQILPLARQFESDVLARLDATQAERFRRSLDQLLERNSA
ncbi:MAG: MarR family winged helix-turn-helix transcriptional regulator [Pseudomonadota bacterium]